MLSFFNFSTNPHATDKSGACLRLTEIEREGRGSYQIQRISLKDPIDTPNGGYNYEICPQRVGGKFCPASLSQKERLYVPPFFLAFPFATCTSARLSCPFSPFPLSASAFLFSLPFFSSLCPSLFLLFFLPHSPPFFTPSPALSSCPFSLPFFFLCR